MVSKMQFVDLELSRYIQNYHIILLYIYIYYTENSLDSAVFPTDSTIYDFICWFISSAPISLFITIMLQVTCSIYLLPAFHFLYY
jgi:ABC-type Na+ efflux pump permease subunit